MEAKLIEMDTIIRQLIDEYFTEKTMRQYAHEFLTDKRTEPLSRFGLLAEYHYKMFGGKSEGIYSACAAIELFMLASDVIDDIQDQDNLTKRWMQIPMPLALNVGIGLLQLVPLAINQCKLTMNEAHVNATLEMMNRQMLLSLNGQMLDLNNDIADIPAYMDMVEQKSASILVLACMTGVMLATGEWNATVAAYAKEIGLASQLKNDLKDLQSFTSKNDFLKRKRTAPLLFIADTVEAPEHLWIKDYVEGRIDHICPESIKQLVDVCEQTGTFIASSVQMRVHYYHFLEKFTQLPETAPHLEEFEALFFEWSRTTATPQS